MFFYSGIKFLLAPEVASTLYPHQKKALTFLLEREREIPPFCGKPSSLWQEKLNPLTGQKSWIHLVTEREVFQMPHQAKSAILADDVRLLSVSSSQIPYLFFRWD